MVTDSLRTAWKVETRSQINSKKRGDEDAMEEKWGWEMECEGRRGWKVERFQTFKF